MHKILEFRCHTHTRAPTQQRNAYFVDGMGKMVSRYSPDHVGASEKIVEGINRVATWNTRATCVPCHLLVNAPSGAPMEGMYSFICQMCCTGSVKPLCSAHVTPGFCFCSLSILQHYFLYVPGSLVVIRQLSYL